MAALDAADNGSGRGQGFAAEASSPISIVLGSHEAPAPETIMVTTTNRILDDIARLVTDAAGAAQGVRREVEAVARTQIERLLRELDVVSREEFEAVREMALLAREENEKLATRLAALEAAQAKN
jgi:BMFP domain-containing protein YqiC